jgi:hypothetical protein
MNDTKVTVVGEVKYTHLQKSAQTSKKSTSKKTESKKDK